MKEKGERSRSFLLLLLLLLILLLFILLRGGGQIDSILLAKMRFMLRRVEFSAGAAAGSKSKSMSMIGRLRLGA